MPKSHLNALLLASVSTALSACSSTSHKPAAAIAPSPIVFAEPIHETPTAEPVTRPGYHKAYFLGRVVDAQYPELMHGEGIVFRRERAEAWNTSSPTLQPATYHTGPIRTLTNGSEAPGMTAADTEIHEARTTAIVDALMAQNTELIARLADVTTPPSAPAADAATPAQLPSAPRAARSDGQPAPLVGQPDRDPDVTLPPSADNIIELSPALLEPQSIGMSNPFRQRYQFETQLRETKITLNGISLGPVPSCVIGEKIYNAGDSFESFTIESIDADGIFLRKESFLLRIPMQEAPITLRYP
jgi:hypothetical protein